MFPVKGLLITTLLICTFTAVLTVGFTNHSDLSVKEGEVVILCADILSPARVDRNVLLLATTVPITAISE